MGKSDPSTSSKSRKQCITCGASLKSSYQHKRCTKCHSEHKHHDDDGPVNFTFTQAALAQLALALQNQGAPAPLAVNVAAGTSPVPALVFTATTPSLPLAVPVSAVNPTVSQYSAYAPSTATSLSSFTIPQPGNYKLGLSATLTNTGAAPLAIVAQLNVIRGASTTIFSGDYQGSLANGAYTINANPILANLQAGDTWSYTIIPSAEAAATLDIETLNISAEYVVGASA